MKRLSATIEEAKLARISDLFRRKPPGLRIGDTDAALLSLKTEEGKTLDQIFYFRLKADGTFTTSVIGRSTRRNQRKFAKFLTHYGITDDPERFNVKKRFKEVEGKKVEVIPRDKGGSIYLPRG